jgi:succinate dehydrogenase/fumarate reductase flavoprotein subunit
MPQGLDTQVYETDILVVGHGIAGLAAAISAKENQPSLRVTTGTKGALATRGRQTREADTSRLYQKVAKNSM